MIKSLRIFSVGSTKEITAACYVECKGLTTTDYVDLTWTTFAEFERDSNSQHQW
jgi:hypothetical protein